MMLNSKIEELNTFSKKCVIDNQCFYSAFFKTDGAFNFLPFNIPHSSLRHKRGLYYLPMVVYDGTITLRFNGLAAC